MPIFAKIFINHYLNRLVEFMSSIYSVITGTGSYVPPRLINNSDFLTNEFYDTDGKVLTTPNSVIVNKFQEITTISQRRYANDDQVTSDLALIAAQRAIEDAGIDKEDLDYVIFGHNFGEATIDNNRTDIVPTLSARLKQKLGIESPNAVAYDVLFGCPGWLQGVIQADYYIKSGDAKKILVVGGEILSRLSDPHDRDSMIYADGAGAVVLEGRESDTPIGILGHNSRTDSYLYAQMLRMGYSNNPKLAETKDYFLKMNGRRLYMYALENVPKSIKAGLDKLGLHINQIKKILIHQANGKMDDAILKRLYELYDIQNIPEEIMPMTISWLGNSSVATLPTLFDVLMHGELNEHEINSGDLIIFASVGAGMSINSMVYKMP